MIARTIGAAVCSALALGITATQLQASEFPERPVTLVVPSTPGSPLDILARVFSAEAADLLKQPIVVETRPGGSGNVGGGAVARSAPDGHTILLALDNLATVNPTIFGDDQFNALRDLRPVTVIGEFSQALVAPRQLGVTTLDEFMKLARERDLTYGTAGIGSPGHLTMEAFNLATGLSMTHVPYKGNPPAVNDMLAGLVDTGFLVVAGVMPHIEAGNFVPLAVSGKEPNALLPDVPTVASAGIPGAENFESTFAYWIAVPKDTPDEIVQRWNDIFQQMSRRPTVMERFKVMDIKPVFSSTEEAVERMKREAERWKTVIEKAKIGTS